MERPEVLLTVKPYSSETVQEILNKGLNDDIYNYPMYDEGWDVTL